MASSSTCLQHANYPHATQRKRKKQKLAPRNVVALVHRKCLSLPGMSHTSHCVPSHVSHVTRNLFMIEYLKENPDTTTDEFDKVWRMLNADTKEVCFPFAPYCSLLSCRRAGIRRAKAPRLPQLQPQVPPKTPFQLPSTRELDPFHTYSTGHFLHMLHSAWICAYTIEPN